jgi:hypothetical protein
VGKVIRKIENIAFTNKTGEPPFPVRWTEHLVIFGKIKLSFNRVKRFQAICNAVDFYWKKVKEK